jgi:hypothetical protein
VISILIPFLKFKVAAHNIICSKKAPQPKLNFHKAINPYFDLKFCLFHFHKSLEINYVVVVCLLNSNANVATFSRASTISGIFYPHYAKSIKLNHFN